MTERGRGALARDAHHLAIKRSALAWDGRGLTIDIDERAAPFPRRVRGRIRVEPTGVNATPFLLETQGRHVWRPIAPSARVSAHFSAPDLRWNGHGYFDMNAGDEPLEAGFSHWSWSRARLGEGACILYDTGPRREKPLSMGLVFDAHGGHRMVDPPPKVMLPSSRWRLRRETRSESGEAKVMGGLEDAPFYARSLVQQQLFGARVVSMHESLSLDRFANPIVKTMLPFRMPRW